MSFYEQLNEQTSADRAYLLDSPIIRRCMTGDVTVADYVAFLTQAYHHVKHTVPLLMAVGSVLPDSREWLREVVAEYIEEEIGHQEWILNDIAACGFDKETVRHSMPSLPTELMVAYAWDTVRRGNPLGFFGMVHVLEGTSVTTADAAASAIRKATGLPERAFTYLRSHGALDQDHVRFFRDVMERIDDPADRQAIVHGARVFYQLYAGIFRALPAGLSEVA